MLTKKVSCPICGIVCCVPPEAEGIEHCLLCGAMLDLSAGVETELVGEDAKG